MALLATALPLLEPAATIRAEPRVRDSCATQILLADTRKNEQVHVSHLEGILGCHKKKVFVNLGHKTNTSYIQFHSFSSLE